MHLYAPGRHTYRVVQVTIDPQPWLRTHDTVYPASEIYHFKPLDERVEVFMKPFTVRRDLTLLATPAVQKQLAAMTSVTITGALDYQACDDKLCFNPARVPFSFTVGLKPLDRRPPGDPTASRASGRTIFSAARTRARESSPRSQVESLRQIVARGRSSRLYHTTNDRQQLFQP